MTLLVRATAPACVFRDLQIGKSSGQQFVWGSKFSSKVRFQRRASSKSCIKEVPEVVRHEAISRWDLSLNASGSSVSVDSRICE